MKITDSVHADSDDYISILKELTEDEIKILAESGINKAANLEIKSHLSLTGASGKTGLYYNQDSKKWYLPVGSALTSSQPHKPKRLNSTYKTSQNRLSHSIPFPLLFTNPQFFDKLLHYGNIFN